MAFEIENGVLRKYKPEPGETEVVIPSGVTKIGEKAFLSSKNFAKVTIPNGVTSIGEYAFEGCLGLSQICIPRGVTDISNGSFKDCRSLQQVTLPDGIMSIGYEAFSQCYKLKKIILPESVNYIGKNAFDNACVLSEINIPESLKDADSKKFVIENNTLIEYLGWGIEKEIVIPDGITIIGNDVFERCESITRVTIPKGVTVIGNNAFRCCYNLSEISIPEGITKIGSRAFFYCSSLAKIQLPATLTQIDNDSYSITGSKIVKAGGKFTVIAPEELKPLLKKTGLMGHSGILTKFISSTPKSKPKSAIKKKQNIELLADAATITAWVKNQSYFSTMQKKFPADKMPKLKLKNNKPAPVEALQFIAYSYFKSITDLPGQNKTNYRTAVGKASFMPDADELADFLDRDSLCEALSELAFEETYFRDYHYEQEYKVPVNKKASGKEKGFSFTDWRYEISVKYSIEMATDPYWEIAVHALCRYGDEAMIDQVCKWINHFLDYQEFEQRGRKYAVLGRTALLLSDTRRAAMYLDKCGALGSYAQMRDKTEAEIRDGFASALGFGADGTVSLDDED